MTIYIFRDQEADVSPENEAAFDAAGWVPKEEPPVEKPSKKDDK